MTYIPWPTGTTHTIDAFDQCEDFMTVLTMTTFINHMSPSPDAIEFVDIFSADGNYEVRYKSNVLIYPDGEVLWIPPAIYQVFHQHRRFHHHQISYYLSNCNHGAFQSSCTIDVTYFPFDQQTCIMKFGSWTFTGDQVFTPIMFIMIYKEMQCPNLFPMTSSLTIFI